MDRIERITAMERALNEGRNATGQMQEAIAALVDATDSISALSAYYGSNDWYDDRRADERGKLPENLARGVLTEDEPYEVLVDAREAALGMLEVATGLLRAL